MGIHDYVDFIQRNGQFITPLVLLDEDNDDNSDSCDDNDGGDHGSGNAIIVKIPSKYTKRDILSWSLVEFIKYPIITAEYSWDDWDFRPSLGYDNYLHDSDKWHDAAIWQSEMYPDEWLINFDPISYEVFVLGKSNPNLVSWEFYTMIFSNRYDSCPGMSLTSTSAKRKENNSKLDAFNLIVESGVANLYTYDDKHFAKIQNAQHEVLLYKHAMNPIFSKQYSYRYQLPEEIKNNRFQILLQDNIRLVDLLRPRVNREYESRFNCAELPHKINIRFESVLPVELSRTFTEGCIVCTSTRSIGHYTCYDHLSQEHGRIVEHNNIIKEEYMKLIYNIELVDKSTIPNIIKVSFTERQKSYTIILELE